MMALLVGLPNLMIGAAYAGLGLLSAWEAISLHSYRGWSRFGLGFAFMAASCGPHHLVHGWYVLNGEPVSYPLVVSALLGLPAGLAFIWLRLETLCGGRGERSFRLAPESVLLSTVVLAAVAGALLAWSLVQPVIHGGLQHICSTTLIQLPSGTSVDLGWLSSLCNVFVSVTYGMVGWYLADHQARRHRTHGAWSLSGVALAGVFFTCAQMHLIDATAPSGGLMLLFDVMGVPASVYFLWVVRQVHSDSVGDWNRHPLVGAAGIPDRPSPWSRKSPQPG